MSRPIVSRHGHARGGRQTTEYSAWLGMKKRCTKPNNSRYGSYGGRGITVCKRWMDSFQAFLADMGLKPSPDLSIDRIDNDGNYEPGNCRWATKEEQSSNKRRGRKHSSGYSAADIELWQEVSCRAAVIAATRIIEWEIPTFGNSLKLE